MTITLDAKTMIEMKYFAPKHEVHLTICFDKEYLIYLPLKKATWLEDEPIKMIFFEDDEEIPKYPEFM